MLMYTPATRVSNVKKSDPALGLLTEISRYTELILDRGNDVIKNWGSFDYRHDAGGCISDANRRLCICNVTWRGQ